MLRIGLTGGIGSGKSTVGKIFEVLGVPVLYADAVAKQIMNDDANVKTAIKSNFGNEAYVNDVLSTKYLSEIVFSNKEKIEILNSIVHPATIDYANDWMKKQASPYVIKEAALIFESGSQENLDYVIGVKSPQALRIHRAIKRDNLTREQVLARMSKQVDEEIKMRLCDFLIVNDEQEMVMPQVLELHKKLLELSAR
jgi:dephospho-CoA kinase